MMGHDIVPHLHQDEMELCDHSATVPLSSTAPQSGLDNFFSHFQHSPAQRHLVYLQSVEKKADFKIKTALPFTFVYSSLSSLLWYANYKKHRFRENNIPPLHHYLASSSFRGPPSC